jgi:hypothetical protein
MRQDAKQQAMKAPNWRFGSVFISPYNEFLSDYCPEKSVQRLE